MTLEQLQRIIEKKDEEIARLKKKNKVLYQLLIKAKEETRDYKERLEEHTD
jgi:hypothetical protein